MKARIQIFDTKKATTFLFMILIALFAFSCGGKKNQDEMVVPEGMHALDLSRFGKPFAIFVPDTLKQRLSVIEQTSGALDVKVGNNFAISIFEQAADIELKKTDIKGDEINKWKNFLTEEPNAIIWESEITQPEYHFLINQKIGTADYSFEDVKDPDTNPFGREAIQKMYTSCKDIKEIKK